MAAAALAFHAGASAQAVPDTLGKIRAAGQINIAYSPDSIPFSATGPDNQPAGYSIDLCKAIAAAVGRAVGNANLKVNWIARHVSERLAAVKAGRADIECGNTTATISRMADVDFSSLVFVDSGGFLVRSDGPIQSIEGFKGKKIGVIAGTTTEQRLALMLKLQKLDATIVPVRDGPEGPAMLEAGTLDAFAGDKVKLGRPRGDREEPEHARAARRGFQLRALRVRAAARRLVVPPASSTASSTRIYVTGEIEGIFLRSMGKLGRPSGVLAAMYLLNAIPD